MTPEIIKAIQDRLDPHFKYVDLDWGQLDNYELNPPVNWPCCLMDFITGQVIDHASKKELLVMDVSFRVAHNISANSSSKSTSRDRALEVLNLVSILHAQLKGFQPAANTGQLTRVRYQRKRRSDGIKEYEAVYRMQFFDDSGAPTQATAQMQPTITFSFPNPQQP